MPTGTQRFAVLCCKFSDSPAEPRPSTFLRDLIAVRGTGGLNDYWIAASLGNINLDGTDVYDWTPLGVTLAEFVAARPSRHDKIAGAVEAFPNVDFSQYQGVIAVFNLHPLDDGHSGLGVLAGPDNLNVTYLGHETGHHFGMQHSYDESSRRNKSWSQLGEYYDRLDIMSAMNVAFTMHPLFNQQGPLPCTPNLDALAWLPPERVFRIRSGSSSSDTIDLVSLSRAGSTTGFLAAVAGNIYVEFRTAEGWDAGLDRAGVVIHRRHGPNATILAKEVPPAKKEPPTSIGGQSKSYPQDWQVGEVYESDPLSVIYQGGTTVAVEAINADAGIARVRISVRAAPPRVAGPAIFVGAGATGDGGGFVVLPSGKVVHIGPRGLRVVEAVLAAEHAEAISASPELRGALTEAVTRELTDIITTLQAR